MKIYTKKGDKGRTQLLGGDEVDKFNPRVIAYGNIDELNAFIGHLHDHDIHTNHKEFLTFIQIQLLNLGSIISSDGKKQNIDLPIINQNTINKIEIEIDKLEKKLEPLAEFILPSGDKMFSLCHIARTVCRRAERKIVLLSSIEEVDPIHIMLLNRLSDYLFVLSRMILKDNSKTETYWK